MHMLFIAFRSIQRKYATGRPDQKDLNENLAATQGLAHMIAECNHLFEVQDTFYVMFDMRCVCIQKILLFTLESVQNKYKSFSWLLQSLKTSTKHFNFMLFFWKKM